MKRQKTDHRKENLVLHHIKKERRKNVDICKYSFLPTLRLLRYNKWVHDLSSGHGFSCPEHLIL